MPAYLSPVGNEQQSDANGSPLAGGFIYTYVAGTTTPIATYTDADGLAPQANPIVLNASGLPANPIWLPAGQAVKLVIQNSASATQRTIDDITGINDPALTNTVDQWITFSGAPTFLSATSFSLSGDQTNIFTVLRRVRTTNTGGTVYGTITASSYSSGTGLTTITVSNDSGSLDAGLSAVAYGLLSPDNPSVPANYLKSLRGYLAGLTLSTAGSSATFSVAAGQAADSTNTLVLSLSASISKTTSAWAVGTGNGALDTGAIANNTWYHVYLIRRPDTSVVDVVVSTNATTPTLPSNYTQFRRIGSMRTNASAQWTAFIQDGDFFQWLTPVADVSAASTGTSAVTRTLTVPTGLNVRAKLNASIYVQNTAGIANTVLYLSDLATADIAPALSSAVTLICGRQAADNFASTDVQVRTNTSGQIRSRNSSSDAAITNYILTLGWFDTRGRDA